MFGIVTLAALVAWFKAEEKWQIRMTARVWGVFSLYAFGVRIPGLVNAVESVIQFIL